ncbi:hypothetical protein [Halalkalibacter krulwichiae]|uniref:Uncharacterized protein n=1 Tax=Halalkalibacter krulwichiae TaxID=199441 RepID=A0A1X9MBM4_9BACI|nr:hypothetical protein [Halalkalibacter krulwichiae]ARK30798.1 hypothetical protein BkAM31D_13660 [Halalkalibacter krulwichiae]
MSQSITAQLALAYQALTESDLEALNDLTEEYDNTLETEEAYVEQFLL